MIQCEGFPQVGCDAPATNNLLGFELCDVCAENWRTTPTREDQQAGALIVQLRDQFAQAQRALEAERAARQNADRRERAAASVVNAARIACERSLFPGRGVLSAALAVYDDAVQKGETR